MPERPPLDRHLSIDNFRSFYWLKEELAQFCRLHGLSPSGAKLELAARIEGFLTGTPTVETPRPKRPRRAARVESEGLSLDTVITVHYTNSQANRAFFQSVIGPPFHFTTNFMQFFKENVGKTYGDAVAEWYREQQNKKSNTQKTQLAPQFQYNQYIRDYLQENPSRSIRDAIAAWNKKKQQRGTMKYAPTDVE